MQILIHPIQKEAIFEKLFKNDIVIYGTFVRQLLIEGKSLKELSKNSNHIHAYGKAVYRDIVERDLHKYISGQIMYNKKDVSGNFTVIYNIKIDKLSFILQILYVRSIIDYSPKFYENELHSIIDIDGLCIDRTGIRCMELFNNAPYLFSEVLNNINNNIFNFKPTILRLTSLEKKYIQSLLNKNYINTGSKIEEIVTEPEELCSICYESDDKPYIRLDCNHIYHKECITESINLFYSDPEKIYFKCPYCSNEYIEPELMIAD